MTNSKYEAEIPTETTLFWLDRQKLVEDESILYKHLIFPHHFPFCLQKIKAKFSKCLTTFLVLQTLHIRLLSMQTV